MPLPGLAHQHVYGVEVYQRDDEVTVVLTEVDDNAQGTSISNALEAVATNVVEGLIEVRLVRDPNSVRWVEHYPEQSPTRNVPPDLSDWHKLF